MIKKIFMFFAAFLIAAIPVLAEDQFFEMKDFSKGLTSQVSPFVTQSGAATDLLNVRINEQFGALTKRPDMLLYATCRAAAIRGLHRFYKSDNTNFTIASSSTYLDYVDESSASCVELKSGLTDGKHWNFVTYKDIAIGMNGFDNAIKWDGKTQTTANTDGSRTAGYLVADLGAPFAELNTGTDLDAAAWYQYKVAFYDGSVYKFSNARSNPILTGAAVYNITLTDIPLGPTGTTSRIIYRTVGDVSAAAVMADTTFYKVDAIADNSTRTYNDAIADDTIDDDAAPTWDTVSAGINATPPKARFAAINRERLFIANVPANTSGKSEIDWSDVFNPDYFNYNTDYELIRPDDGDEITFLKIYLGTPTIGKTNSIQKFYTDATSSTGWYFSEPFSFIGCPAPYSAVSTPLGIIYLGRFGIYVFNGSNSQLISDVVTKDIRDISQVNIPEAVGIFHDNQYNLAYTSDSTGASVNDRVIVLDTVRNAYVKDSKNIDSFVIFDSGDDFGALYSGSSSTDGKILAHSSSPTNIIVRDLADLNAGTASDVGYFGDDDAPQIEIAWTKTIDDASFAGVTIDAYTPATAIIDRPDTSGTWTSPIFEINATNLNKLYWNETLGSTGNVTFAIRSAATSGGIAAAAWSSEFSNPSGSDLSALTANNFLQMRATLSDTVITSTPNVFSLDNFLIKLTYSKVGSSGETAINSYLISGWEPLSDAAAQNGKRIKEILIFYSGTSGTLNFRYENNEGDIDKTFSIDLSVLPETSSTDDYVGTASQKIHRYIPPVALGEDFPTGKLWRFTVSEGGVTQWAIQKIVIRHEVLPYVPFP